MNNKCYFRSLHDVLGGGQDFNEKKTFGGKSLLLGRGGFHADLASCS